MIKYLSEVFFDLFVKKICLHSSCLSTEIKFTIPAEGYENSCYTQELMNPVPCRAFICGNFAVARSLFSLFVFLFNYFLELIAYPFLTDGCFLRLPLLIYNFFFM